MTCFSGDSDNVASVIRFLADMTSGGTSASCSTHGLVVLLVLEVALCRPAEFVLLVHVHDTGFFWNLW